MWILLKGDIMLNYDCPLCKERNKNVEHTCAFQHNDRFSHINFNCATLNELRRIAHKIGLTWRDDNAASSIGVVPFEGEEYQGYIVMTWYKDYAEVGNAVLMLDDEPVQELNLTMAEEAIKYWEWKLNSKYD